MNLFSTALTRVIAFGLWVGAALRLLSGLAVSRGSFITEHTGIHSGGVACDVSDDVFLTVRAARVRSRAGVGRVGDVETGLFCADLHASTCIHSLLVGPLCSVSHRFWRWVCLDWFGGGGAVVLRA
jgi:hypothetical protein